LQKKDQKAFGYKVKSPKYLEKMHHEKDWLCILPYLCFVEITIKLSKREVEHYQCFQHQSVLATYNFQMHRSNLSFWILDGISKVAMTIEAFLSRTFSICSCTKPLVWRTWKSFECKVQRVLSSIKAFCRIQIFFVDLTFRSSTTTTHTDCITLSSLYRAPFNCDFFW